MHCDVIVIGAGASGLMAARELTASGYKVCVLEAMGKAGGRISSQFILPGTAVEGGAEFIHGKAPVTHNLIREAGFETLPVGGKMLTVRNGVWLPETHQEKGCEKFSHLLSELETDTTLLSFLDQYLPESEYGEVRKSVRLFSEGFGLVDISRVSAHSIMQEWQHQEERQYRLKGGYSQLIQFLLDDCVKNGASIHYSNPVHTIEHKKGEVFVETDKRRFAANKVIITVSAGVMRSGAIKFAPAIENYAARFRDLGFGSVIKILIHFTDPFWKEKDEDIGFLLSDEVIPTWWTQAPLQIPLLTGWLGGPEATRISRVNGNTILEKAIKSLSGILHMKPATIQNKINGYKIFCWDNDPFTKGGYSYHTLQSATAKKVLIQPLNNTVYFAGEALDTGDSPGTVEAALASGKSVAELIRNSR